MLHKNSITIHLQNLEERKAADLYLAGSLAAQLFLGHCMSALIQTSLLNNSEQRDGQDLLMTFFHTFAMHTVRS